MKQAALLKLARRVLDERFLALGFQYEHGACGAYYRELPTKVIHIMWICTERTNDTFQAVCGLNSRLISPDKDIISMGVFGKQHVTPQGWDCNSAKWPCTDESAALKSLTTIRGLIDSLIEPWFQSKITLSSMAELMQQYPSDQFILYRAVGDLKRARKALQAYRDRLSHPQPWDDPKAFAAQRDKVDVMLRELG